MKKIDKNMQAGGMLLEMIAVLGLVAVSAPAIYKKNIERTEEIRDMTKASQLRVLKDAASQYVEKQYDAIIRDSAANNWTSKTIAPSALANYLPDGYQIDDGIQIYLTAKRQNTEGNRPQGLVSAIVLDNEEVTEPRGNRIARMVGVEGGYTMDGNVYGNHGAWSLSAADLGAASIPENRVAVSSTYSKNLSSSDYIYRNKVEGYPEANMMFTDVDMNGSSIDHLGRLAMRYNNGDKWADPQIGGVKEGSTGDSADATRDKGLSLLVHGERGEIVGKTRSDAKNNDYQWWGKARDANGDISTADGSETLTDTTHFANKATLELSVGGPTKATGERDGYLRLRANDSNACTRIESNYRMPDRNLTATGLTGGGAFVACLDTGTESALGTGDSLGGAMGSPTASLVADDKPDTGTPGSGYLIVTNPNNNRKAVMYGNYTTSFFNTKRDDYTGSAMETVNAAGKVVALSASSLTAGMTGANNGVTHAEEGAVTNLYDQNGNVKTQFRADERGGFIYAYGDNGSDYSDLPTVAVKGAKDADDANPNESYAVVTRRKDKGYAIMQSNYKEDAGDIPTGAFMIKDEDTKNEVAVMGNKTLDASAGGYFALKDGNTKDRFRALASSKGGAIYMGNAKNDSRLSGSGDNLDRTVMLETDHNGSAGGYMKISSGKGSLEVTSNTADADTEQGGGMFATKTDGKLTAKLHSSTKGDLNGDAGVAATAGGGVALASNVASSKAELVTSYNDGTGGTFSLKNGSSRNVLVTARGPNNGGWMSLSRGSAKGVDFYANRVGKGGEAMLSNGGSSLVEFKSGGDATASPVMTVRGGSVLNAYGSMSGVFGQGGGLTTGSNKLTADYGNSGAYQIGGAGVYGSKTGGGAEIDVGGVLIQSNGGGMLSAPNVAASARVKAKGAMAVTNDVESLITSAASYNGFGGANVGAFMFAAIKKHLPSLATKAKDLGHSVCIQAEENCPVYDENGHFLYWGGWADLDSNKWGRNGDVYLGRLHDYSLYAYGEYDGESHVNDARHEAQYDLLAEPTHHIGGSDMHNVASKWHDNGFGSYRTSGRTDTGAWVTAARHFGNDYTADNVPKDWADEDLNR